MRLKLLFDLHQTIIFGTQSVRGLRLPKYQVRNIKVKIKKN